jgi:hypothetical protein
MDRTIHDFDLSGLRTLYKTNSSARHVLESFAGRINNWSSTTVSSLESYFKLTGLKISRKEIRLMFMEFEKFKCGRFIIGKVSGNRNFQSRFIWTVPMTRVGRLALDKRN